MDRNGHFQSPVMSSARGSRGNPPDEVPGLNWAQSLQTAMDLLKGEALYDGPEDKSPYVSPGVTDDECLYVDLANHSGQAIRVNVWVGI